MSNSYTVVSCIHDQTTLCTAVKLYLEFHTDMSCYFYPYQRKIES